MSEFEGRKIPVGIIGATGMVGQRFTTLLENHPWFEVTCVAASPRSAGRPYAEAVHDRWVMPGSIPQGIASLNVLSVEDAMKSIADQTGLLFSALDLPGDKIREIENGFAELGIPIVSNNSAHRWTQDVPMIIPEINPKHLDLIGVQQRNHGWNRGFVVVKPNCSIQSYVPLLTPLLEFEPTKLFVVTEQAVSGAGRTLNDWPEIRKNVIPFIGGEEEKSEKEPLKIWGKAEDGVIKLAEGPVISAVCTRVPVEDGHTASVAVSFAQRITGDEILARWQDFNPLRELNLPSSPQSLITFMKEEDRPQARLDCMIGNGMGISAGRLAEDRIFDWRFIGLSHNTIRGAAGGGILTAELLKVQGYI